ncbi:MAG: PIN domain-containing protein [Chthoniobacterales bacterium]
MLVAVDTNVLIDQALDDANVIGALATIQKRLENVKLIVTPTVLHELAWAVDHSDEPEVRNAALRALEHLQEWGYQPLNVIPVGHGIVEQISLKIRMVGILPDEEENDASIIAEAALIGCGILLTADSHLLDAQEKPDFRQTLKDCDVEGEALVIARPVTIVTKFFRTA